MLRLKKQQIEAFNNMDIIDVQNDNSPEIKLVYKNLILVGEQNVEIRIIQETLGSSYNTIIVNSLAHHYMNHRLRLGDSNQFIHRLSTKFSHLELTDLKGKLVAVEINSYLTSKLILALKKLTVMD